MISEALEEDNSDLESIIKSSYESIKDKLEEASRIKNGSMMKNYHFLRKQVYEWVNPNNHRRTDNEIVRMLNMLLNHIQILRMESEDLNDALDIFQTINDRGVQLDDTDILKVEIYPTQKKDQSEFLKRWNELKDHQNIFNIYMHIIRADNGVTDTSTKSVRRFFLKDDYGIERIGKNWEKVMEELEKINDITNTILEDANEEIAMWWNILDRGYPGRRGTPFWQLPIYVFLYNRLNKRNKENKLILSKSVEKELRELILTTLKYFTIIGTCYNNSRTRSRAYQTCAAIVEKHDDDTYNKGNYLKLYKEKIKEECVKFKNIYKERQLGNYKKLIVYLGASLNKKQNKADFSLLLNSKNDIEHILPKSWKIYRGKHKGPSAGWKTTDDHKRDLERVGNLMPLEKELNIEALNHTFEDKKEAYAKSILQDAKDLSKAEQEWNPDELTDRDGDIRKRVFDFLKPS